MSVEQIGLPGGELEKVVGDASVFLSFKETKSLRIGKRKSYATADHFVSLLVAEYWQLNMAEETRSLENVKFFVQRLRPLGSCALKDSFTFKIINSTVSIENDTKLVGESPRIDIYTINNTEEQHEPYVGFAQRSDFPREDLAAPMTLPDCNDLTTVMDNIRAIEQRRRNWQR